MGGRRGQAGLTPPVLSPKAETQAPDRAPVHISLQPFFNLIGLKWIWLEGTSQVIN